MFPSTTERVPLHTAAHVNEQIRRRIEENVAPVRDEAMRDEPEEGCR